MLNYFMGCCISCTMWMLNVCVHFLAGTKHVKVIAAVVGPVSFLLLAVLGVSATKAIMTYYEKLRLQ